MQPIATTTTLDSSGPVDTRLKIASLWISMLLVFAYVDIFSLYRPGVLAEIQGGSIYKFEITQTFLFFTTLYVAIPSLLIPLTLTMPPRLNRAVNIVVAALYAITVVGNAVGEWTYYIFGSAIEAGLLFAVIYQARALVPAADESL